MSKMTQALCSYAEYCGAVVEQPFLAADGNKNNLTLRSGSGTPLLSVEAATAGNFEVLVSEPSKRRGGGDERAGGK